ncbi:BED finger NBS-LRR resistance protein, putative [Medicago truncatula]|uniref:BED finger NBS-LRR resistance protein, putative n=1 Tax=Medicago truncatula TaxID=3880 RepID=A0A072TWL2_MEDTR|nr:BED finger NBS-LRR resistance protein, putative [Medicago truncatula]
MNMLECLGGSFDCKDHNQHMQKNLDTSFGLKTYHLTLGNYVDDGKIWWKRTNLKISDPSEPETKTILFGDCDHFSCILPEDLTYLCIEKNSHWVCLCDALSYNTYSSLRRIGTSDCQQMESLFCLSGSCSFCTKIHNLEVLELSYLKSLTVVCKDVVNVRLSLTLAGGIFSNLKDFNIFCCHLIEKLFTPQLVQQFQNLEIISVTLCASMKEIFAVSNSDDNDQSIISLPKLTRLCLRSLPQLKTVCEGIILCGSSKPSLYIVSCPGLKRRPTVKLIDGENSFGIFP